MSIDTYNDLKESGLGRSDTFRSAHSSNSAHSDCTSSTTSSPTSALQQHANYLHHAARAPQSPEHTLYHDAPEVVQTWNPRTDLTLMTNISSMHTMPVPNSAYSGQYLPELTGSEPIHPSQQTNLHWTHPQYADPSAQSSTSGTKPYQVMDNSYLNYPGHQPPPVAKRKWYKSLIVWAIVCLVLTILLAVGLGIGLSWKGLNKSMVSTSNQAADHTGTNHGVATRFTGVCKSTNICMQSLSAVTYGSDFSLWIFSRASNNTIQYQIGSYVTANMVWAPYWLNLGSSAPGNMFSPPAALSWSYSHTQPRLDVFAVQASNNSVVSRWYMDGGWSDWTLEWNLTSKVTPRPCSIFSSRIDVFVVNAVTHGVAHNYLGAGSKRWIGDGVFDHPDAPIANTSNMAVTCQSSASVHNLIIYTVDAVDYSQYIPGPAWTPWFQLGGSFLGEPVAFRPDQMADQLSVFGIGNDLNMYFFSVNALAQASALKSLGGPFYSIPSVVSPGSQILDVVALDGDGTVSYRRYNGTDWSDDWVKLGYSSQTAPLVYNSNGFTHFFITGKNADLQHAYWSTNPEADWTQAVFTSIGGNLSLAPIH